MFDFDGGIKFVIDKQLLASATPVKVDVTYTGFTVESSLQLGGGCGCSGCGTGGGDDSGGCGSGSGCGCG